MDSAPPGPPRGADAGSQRCLPPDQGPAAALARRPANAVRSRRPRRGRRRVPGGCGRSRGSHRPRLAERLAGVHARAPARRAAPRRRTAGRAAGRGGALPGLLVAPGRARHRDPQRPRRRLGRRPRRRPLRAPEQGAQGTPRVAARPAAAAARPADAPRRTGPPLAGLSARHGQASPPADTGTAGPASPVAAGEQGPSGTA